jgi:hypothetical protein
MRIARGRLSTWSLYVVGAAVDLEKKDMPPIQESLTCGVTVVETTVLGLQGLLEDPVYGVVPAVLG